MQVCDVVLTMLFQTFSYPFPQYSPQQPTGSIALDICVPQISGEDEVYPSLFGSIIR
jgi:hypothetical protein